MFAHLYGVFGAQYVPGTPGAPWSDEEVIFVQQIVLQMLNESYYVSRVYPDGVQRPGDFSKEHIWDNAYHNCTKDSCDPSPTSPNFMGKGSRRPNAAKLIRLAFHDCVKNVAENGHHFGGCEL